METIKLWARNGDAVRQAIELGDLVHLDTASEELTDEFLLFAIQSGLLSKWAEVFPDPRQEPEIGMEVLLVSQLAARFAGLYSMRKAGYVLRSAAVLGALGYRAGCEFSRVQTRRTLAIMWAKSGSWVSCRQKNTRYAEAAWTMECA